MMSTTIVTAQHSFDELIEQMGRKMAEIERRTVAGGESLLDQTWYDGMLQQAGRYLENKLEVSAEEVEERFRDRLEVECPTPQPSQVVMGVIRTHYKDGDATSWARILDSEELDAKTRSEALDYLRWTAQRSRQLLLWAWHEERLLFFEGRFYKVPPPELPPDELLHWLGAVEYHEQTHSSSAPKRTRGPARPYAPIPRLFANGRTEPLPNDATSRGLVSGVRGVVPYALDEKGRHVATVREKNRAVSTIATVDDPSEVFSEVVRRYGDAAADILKLSIRAYEVTDRRYRDEEGFIELPIDFYLEGRGLEPMWEIKADGTKRNKGYRSADKMAAAETLRHLSRLRVDVADSSDPKYSIRETQVLYTDIFKTPIGQVPGTVKIKVGKWRAESLALDPHAATQYVEADQYLLKLHAQQDIWEKRLGDHIQGFMRLDKKPVLRQNIGEMLIKTGLIAPGKAPVRPYDIRLTFERTMDSIARRGSSMSTWEYESSQKGIKPEGYKWFEKTWLTDYALMTPSAEVVKFRKKNQAQITAHVATAAYATKPTRGRPRKKAAQE